MLGDISEHHTWLESAPFESFGPAYQCARGRGTLGRGVVSFLSLQPQGRTVPRLEHGTHSWVRKMLDLQGKLTKDRRKLGEMICHG